MNRNECDQCFNEIMNDVNATPVEIDFMMNLCFSFFVIDETGKIGLVIITNEDIFLETNRINAALKMECIQ